MAMPRAPVSPIIPDDMNQPHSQTPQRRLFSPGALACALASVLACAGCARQLPVVEDSTEASIEYLLAQRVQADNLRSWRARGRIAVRRSGSGWRGQFDWQQNGRHFDIRLSSLLGGTLMVINGEFGGVAAATGASGRRTEAATPEELISSLLYTDVPVGNLRYWMAGAPAYGARPGEAHVDSGRTLSFSQDGWRVRYTGWNVLHDLPEKIGLSRLQDGNGAAADTTISISIASWSGVVRDKAQ